MQKNERSKMTKKFWVGSLLFIMMMSGVCAEEVKLDAERLQEIKSANAILQDPVLSIKEGIDKGSTYFLKLKATTPRGSQIVYAFLEKATGTIIFGNGYGKDGKALVFPKDAASITGGVAFSYGSGSKEIYLVTDPECPYCAKFAKAADGKLGEYRVNVIFLPLSFHKNAPAMVGWIMSGRDDAEKKQRYDALLIQNSSEYKSLAADPQKPYTYPAEIKKIVDASLVAVEELGAQGTPMIFDAQFRQISPNDLLQPALESNATK